MVERIEYVSGHTGKMPFISEAEARHVARNNNYGVKLTIYKCLFGEFIHWHTSSMSPSRHKKIKKHKRVEPNQKGRKRYYER